jgi:hypothetical protein
MPTDPITVEVVCHPCYGCLGRGRTTAILHPTSLAAAKLALADAVLRYEDTDEEDDGDKIDEAWEGYIAASAAIRAHAEYRGPA